MVTAASSTQEDITRVSDALTKAIDRRLEHCGGEGLMTVRLVAKHIAKELGIKQNAWLNAQVDKLLKKDPRAEPWGYGVARAWNAKTKKKYSTVSRRIYKLSEGRNE